MGAPLPASDSAGQAVPVEPAAPTPASESGLVPVAESAQAHQADTGSLPVAKTPRPPLDRSGVNRQKVAVVIPCKDESERIGATVLAARAIPHVDLVLVVDDGSLDDTQHIAREAGAVVVRHSHNRGKAAAMETGAAVVAMRDAPGKPERLLLFLDGDLGMTAVNTAPLVTPVREGLADVAIALLPQSETARNGVVVKAAQRAITRMTGWTPTQPLSGSRCLTRVAFEAATPLARGWGVEVGMIIDLLRAGFVAVEVPCDLHHRASTNDWAGKQHRAAQYRDVILAVNTRQIRRGVQALNLGRN